LINRELCHIDYKEKEKIQKYVPVDLYQRINSITKTCSKLYFNKILKKLAEENQENAIIICDYITAEETELNIKNSTKESRIKVLVWLSNFHNNTKSFKQMTKQNILDYLNSLRKSTIDDSTQRWIGSYNGRQMILSKFFRWLYSPEESDQRKRLTPTCMKGIKQLPRKEKTPYRPSDLWESREHAIFLKYCPSVRDRCYHSLANDMSARPHEILNLKIKDIVFKVTDEGKQYSEVVIKGGKTRSRTIPLIDSLPYVKDWINNHPHGTNPDSWLFISNSNTTFGSKLTYDGLTYQYKYFYKTKYFPKLLEDKTIPEPDKSLIKNMLTKPWNLYIFRHSALTEKSQILKEHVLRDHAGWTMSSKMPQTYIHYFGNESSKSLLQLKGIIKKEDIEKSLILKSSQCPNCQEPNKPGSKFCIKCRMVLTYDSYSKTLDEKAKQENRINQLELEIQQIKQGQQELLELLKHPEQLIKIANIERFNF
jgi:integrase